MKIKIHYTSNGNKDSLIINGNTLKEIQEIAKKETEKRGLDVEKNNCWSEKLSD